MRPALLFALVVLVGCGNKPEPTTSQPAPKDSLPIAQPVAKTAGGSLPHAKEPDAPADADADVKRWLKVYAPGSRIIETKQMPIKGFRVYGVVGEMAGQVLADAEWEAGGKKGPKPVLKKDPDPVDMAYLIVTEADRRRQRWCALRKVGGGISLLWEIDRKDDWQVEAVRFVK